MVLVRPVTRTRISTETFGHPVFDWITANTPTAWTAPTMQNGWTSVSPMLVKYRKLGDYVQCQGRLGGSTQGVTIFNFPVGFRPATDLDIPTTMYNGSIWGAARFYLNTAGNLQVTDSPSVMFVSALFQFPLTIV